MRTGWRSACAISLALALTGCGPDSDDPDDAPAGTPPAELSPLAPAPAGDGGADTVALRGREQGPVQRAMEAGLGFEQTYQVLRGINPYYLRGDFNGDGLIDLAFWVRHRESRGLGIAILPAAMDTIHIFGAGGSPIPGMPMDEMTGPAGTVWTVRPPGWRIEHPHTDLPGLVERGVPVEFPTETIEVLPTLNGFALVWHAGRFHVVWISD